MSEKENTNQNQKSKVSKLAITSLLFGNLGITVLFVRAIYYRPWWNEYVARNVIFISGIIGVILGFIVLRKVSKRTSAITLFIILSFLFIQISPYLNAFIIRRGIRSFLVQCIFFLSLACLLSMLVIAILLGCKSRLNRKLKYGAFASFGIFLGVLLLGFWWMETYAPVSRSMGMPCSHKLRLLGEAILIYSNDNQGRYPEPNQWCDILLQSGQAERDHFLCPWIKWKWKRQIFPFQIPINKKCYYAMNPDCEPNSPDDMVLLFETKGGWNRFGGPELLTTENHLGRRCNILFNNGRVEIFGAEELNKLKWKISEISSN